MEGFIVVVVLGCLSEGLQIFLEGGGETCFGKCLCCLCLALYSSSNALLGSSHLVFVDAVWL